jgi:HK97 family phage portal protein
MTWLQMLSAAFKGGGSTRPPLSSTLFQPGIVPFAGATIPGDDYDYARAVREGVLANPIAQRAVRLVCEGIGKAPIVADAPKALALMESASAGQCLLESAASHLLLHGNAYLQILKDASGQPVELYALRPDRMRVVADSQGWPKAYHYSLASQVMTIPIEDEDGWPNLITIKSLHPLDDHYGAGALQAAWPGIAIHNAASQWNRSLLENAARPSGALVHHAKDGAALTSDQFERLKNELRDAFTGAHAAGRPMLLDGGLSWQSLALTPADMDFATLKSAAARDIALAFGVPPMLLGLPGDNTYANYREANRALWRLTLLPLANRLLSAIGDGLSAWFPKAQLRIDLDAIPALSEERDRLWQQVSQASFLSDAEKRQLLGLTPSRTQGADDDDQ